MKPSEPKWIPLWRQRLQWLFYLCFALWFALLMFGDPFEHPNVTMGLFAVMMVPAAVRAYFMMHAVGRGEINPLTTRSTRKTDE